MIFPELMAEMRRPRDFIKGMALAQLLIFVVYLVYGVSGRFSSEREGDPVTESISIRCRSTCMLFKDNTPSLLRTKVSASTRGRPWEMSLP